MVGGWSHFEIIGGSDQSGDGTLVIVYDKSGLELKKFWKSLN